MKKYVRVIVISLALATVVVLGTAGLTAIQGCNGGSTSFSSSGTSSSSSCTSGQSLTANQTNVQSIPTDYGGSCEKLTRDTTSCQSARTALGLSGNWLKFSCNVVLGLATAGGASTTNYASASYVTVTTVDLPDYTSNYYPTTGCYNFTANGTTIAGSYNSLYSAYTTTFPDPSTIASTSITMNIPITPGTGHQTMAAGVVGISINGIGIFNNLADATDNIFAEAGSFDQCQGHPANGKYHYHSEPFSIAYDDTSLIGVMRDGYFIYGRKDYDNTYPGSIANLQTAGSSSNIYVYGGHTGPDPITNTGTTFHYHLTEWKGCYHESGGTKSSDDGRTYDSINSPSNPTCGGSWVDTWFMTGHGNGGAFMTVPSGIGTQAPSQTVAGVRYYYGSAGTCTGC